MSVGVTQQSLEKRLYSAAGSHFCSSVIPWTPFLGDLAGEWEAYGEEPS